MSECLAHYKVQFHEGGVCTLIQYVKTTIKPKVGMKLQEQVKIMSFFLETKELCHTSVTRKSTEFISQTYLQYKESIQVSIMCFHPKKPMLCHTWQIQPCCQLRNSILVVVATGNRAQGSMASSLPTQHSLEKKKVLLESGLWKVWVNSQIQDKEIFDIFTHVFKS